MRETVRRVEKPWGHELLIAHTDSYVGKILVIQAGEALSLQLHREKDETFHVVRGEIELHVDEGNGLAAQPLRAGESYRVQAGTRHRMIAGPEGCELFEVSTPHLEDVVRLEDRYGRV